jgi:hypothetical protein
MIQRSLISSKLVGVPRPTQDDPVLDCCPRLSGQSINLHDIPVFGQYWLGKLDFPSRPEPGGIV